MKLCVLGGAGFRTPFVHQALLRDTGSPRVEELALFDTDPVRLDGMVRVLREMAAEFTDPPRLAPTTDLAEALRGSDFVFAAVRVGGLLGRCRDERVALDLGVLGQETTGPGGIAYALRTVPFMVHVAEQVRRYAPAAHVLNFTNPAGIVTEAMQAVLGDRVLGICDTPSGLVRRVADQLGLDHRRVRPDYVGLNHLGWLRGLRHDGVDVLPRLLTDDASLGALEEAAVFGAGWLRTLGAIPNEYLYYYYRHREALRSALAAEETRGEHLLSTQGAFWQALARTREGAAQLWRSTVNERNATYMAEARGGTAAEHPDRPELDPDQQGYAGVALGVMAAISRDERTTMILNVRNRGTIASLPEDAVVEVPAAVDADGVHPLTTDPPDLHQLGLMQQVKAVERHAIAAAVYGDRDEALRAFALHPLVDSVALAHDLLDGYVERIPEVAAVFRR
ncbi:6-phospho-beta-glucosidase [Paenibacillus sp. TRM 82003]|uniref:6-phospho-beta-glucosidase n=1 Tax=Kineococcus sp. TRM81007 TaxID=2925831 RepID=UPI001F58CECB|nr:6-phospho-beta-glucosidase [Kineococcus sp. TRM81007]MCI2237033.1 6-phospho-beta-glucosidase [Kineococcus sp. TRM81007]MCI3926500.1 6-phospho-beta-glucosidase [Paenibacillus sp. TRM 82003]